MADTPAEAAEVFETIHRLTQERLTRALRLQQALERQAPEAEMEVLRRAYREASDQGHAGLRPLREWLSAPETPVDPLSDDPSSRGHLTKAGLVNRLRQYRRYKKTGRSLPPVRSA